MAGEDIVSMSQKDFRRLHVIERYVGGQIETARAAELLKLSMRQIVGAKGSVSGRMSLRGLVHDFGGGSSTHGIESRQEPRVICI